MTVPKPTLPAYSPGHTTGYMVSGTDYDNDVLQQGERTQLLIEPVTAFPASPALTDWCFRSDLNALYQCTNATGPVWNQMSVGAFATTARPAAPPTNYLYFDMTLKALLQWTGSAYSGLASFMSAAATAQTIITGGTITIATFAVARISTAGNVTGIILPTGTEGQEITIFNETGFTVTFAAQATSNVIGGAGNVIQGFGAQKFTYSSSLVLWAHLV